ncbi:hypothetical protein K402DRAFT_448961 [Aulographum hederae CBS 113979]|uniref:Xylanolytic transcriptional activator regulatory domain-containing protein n=1 Tax=Aulographum hederae CBS 113979 TaxID=1176131 RepID=A0A6G1GLW8_9PEZI|nr:hypothetical protein K402DRAFT_448961 [Aulographum hederae CBS 113979]
MEMDRYAGGSESPIDKTEGPRARSKPPRSLLHPSLLADGFAAYHGPTSSFHVESLKESPQTPTGSAEEVRRNIRDAHLPTLRANAELLHTVWEPLIRSKTEQDFGIPPDLATYLLHIYWLFQHPLHNVVYKPCFVMDLALGGPYCSKFLLMSIFALAARHTTNQCAMDVPDKGELFLQRAKQLLLEEMSENKPKIPTIQGLLLLGARQCAVGNTSEGWVFTGMAIRMLTDIGLHLPTQKLMEFERMAPADLEARKRLFFAAYVWDKTISLTLGRPPGLTRLPHSVEDLFDDSDNTEIWSNPNLEGCPPTPSYNTLAFQNFCRLGELTTLIIASVYNRECFDTKSEDLESMESMLHRWFDALPFELKMEDPANCASCPPPHILSLNLLYHTLIILLYRPYLQVHHVPDLQQYATKACLEQVRIVHSIFVLYGKTFRYELMTYLVNYCVYTAATIDAYEMRSSEQRSREEATVRLSLSLQILESGARQTPGIRRSIDIIKHQLNSPKHTLFQLRRSNSIPRLPTSIPPKRFSNPYSTPRKLNPQHAVPLGHHPDCTN